MMTSASNYFDFFQEVGKSKKILRQGWVREKVKNSESVAEHSFRVAIMAMAIADCLQGKVNKGKLMAMALLHDLSEVVTGDMVTERGEIVDLKKREEKERLEKIGIERIFSLIGSKEKFQKIFNEMSARDTKEAKLFWQIDKLEMAIQAYEYEKEQGKKLDEFFLNVKLHDLQEPILKEIFQEALKRRPKK